MDSLIKIIAFFIIMIMGFITKYISIRLKIKSMEALVHYFTKVLYYVLVPILFIDKFGARGLIASDAKILGIVFFYVCISLILAFIVSVKIKYDEARRKAFLVTTTFQNAVFLGYPMIYIIVGDISAATMYSLVLFVLHISVAGILSGGKNSIVRSILTLPVIYGFLIGNIMHYFFYSMYLSINNLTSLSSLIVTYGAIYVMGFALPLSSSILSKFTNFLALVILWRFIIAPLIHYILLSIINLDYQYYREIMIESFMPPAVMNSLLARLYDWDPEIVSLTILVSTIISIPLVLLLGVVGVI